MGDKLIKQQEIFWRTLWFGLAVSVVGLACLVFAWIDRDAVPVVGTTLLGIVIGMLVGFFAHEAKEWTQSAMSGAVAVLAATGVLALLRYGLPDPSAVWFYPIGLVVGFGFGTIWEAVDPP